MEAAPSTNTYSVNNGVTMGIDALGLAENNGTETTADSVGESTSPQQTTSITLSGNATSSVSFPHPLDGTYPSSNCQSESPQSPRSPDCLSPKVSRRVSFPLGSTVVSGYMDPPNPWQESSTCTTEALVDQYKAACEKQNVKPLPKLLNQLMAITNFCDRNETFTLKGEKLDAKHCETLEEVLRRVQFRTIDVENTHLDDESAVALFDMVEYYESCTRLNISHNKSIGIRGWQSCARLIKKTPCIDCLEARNCALTEQAMPMLGRALRMGSQLTTLHLENAILSGRPLMILVTAIKMNEILRDLYLADNKLMPSDGIQLGNMLKYNHKLQLLDIRNNHLQDVGTSHLCDGLFEQNLGQGLNTLVLWNNQVTYQSMPSLARALVNSCSLETLNLGHNNITNEGVHRLKEGLLHNKSLLRIGLQAAKISCEGAVALAEFIADSPRLLRVDLRENDTKTGGLMALSLALKVSETVTRVDLDKDPKRESGVKDYADQQRRLLQDIQNLMLRNRDLAREREAQAELDRQAEAEAAKAEIEAAEANLERDQQKAASAVEPEAVAAVPTNTEWNEEETPAEEQESPRLALRQLSLELPPRIQTLESPGFVTEAQLPVVSPPSVEQVLSEIAALNASVPKSEVPVEFPPSPMTSQDKSLYAALVKESQQELTTNSPNSRRKFIISKVVEEEAGTPATQPENSSDVSESQGAQAPESAAPMEAGAGTLEPSSLDASANGSSSSGSSAVTDPLGAGMIHMNNDIVVEDSASAEDAASGVNGASGTETEESSEDPITEGEGCSSEVAPEAIKLELDTEKVAEIEGDQSQDSDAVIRDVVSGGDAATPAPNFHTSLSLNGMKVELATVLDTLDKSDISATKTVADESSKAEAQPVDTAVN